VNNRKVAITPAEVELKGELATIARLKLSLRLNGYQTSEQVITHSDQFDERGERLVHEVNVSLEKKPSHGRRREPTSPTGEEPPPSSEAPATDSDEGSAAAPSGSGVEKGGTEGGATKGSGADSEKNLPKEKEPPAASPPAQAKKTDSVPSTSP
jgi:hypothetical protein